MGKSFIPTKDADLVTWSQNFSTLITATPTAAPRNPVPYRGGRRSGRASPRPLTQPGTASPGQDGAPALAARRLANALRRPRSLPGPSARPAPTYAARPPTATTGRAALAAGLRRGRAHGVDSWIRLRPLASGARSPPRDRFVPDRSGVPAKAIAERLGSSSVNLTLNTYSDSRPTWAGNPNEWDGYSRQGD